MKRSKAYRAAAEKIDPSKVYSPLEAVRLAKSTASAKYDETVEVALRLGVDPRKADQMVRGTVNLPHGTGKTARVLVFANGDKAEAAREAGADHVGSDDLLEKVAGGKGKGGGGRTHTENQNKYTCNDTKGVGTRVEINTTVQG